MAYFRKISEMKEMTPEQRKKENELKTMMWVRRDAENKGHELRKELPLPIVPITFDHPMWEQFYHVHKFLWETYYYPIKEDRMFLYHLCLSNLAALISEVDDENKMVVQQALVFLRFGEDYPYLYSHIDSLLTPVLTYNEIKDWRKRDPLDMIRDAVKRIGKPSGGNIRFETDYQDVVKQYIDGCIGLVSNILLRGTKSKQYYVPQEYDERRGRDKTLGDFVDDYLTNLDRQ